MRVLLITDKVPYPPITGAPLYTYHLMRRVAREHDVWMITFAESPEHLAGVANLRAFCQGVETAPLEIGGALDRPLDLWRYVLTGKPPDFRFYDSPELTHKLQQLVSTVDFDVVHIDHSEMGLYLDRLPPRLRQRAIWGLHDIDWVKFTRLAQLETKPARKLRIWLRSAMTRWWLPRQAERFARCLTVSEVDQGLLQAAQPQVRVDVVAVGVDATVCQPLPDAAGPPGLIFVGNMNYLPNADGMVYFCQEILPHIRMQVPDVEVWIVGINPRPEVEQLAGHGVHVTGRVEDVGPYYQRSSVCIVPLRAGSGARLKIYEAMAFGRPVVSTSIGCEGPHVIDGEHLLIADTPEEFAHKTVCLLTDAPLRQRIVNKARQFVVENYDWDVLARQLTHIYTEVTHASHT